MSIGGFLEPGVILVIAIIAIYVNRRRDEDDKDGSRSPVQPHDEPKWTSRHFFRWNVRSRNTRRWRKYLGSLYLRRYPFLVEFWYQFLVYWAYQLGRAFSALTLQISTLEVARGHALSVIAAEKSLGLFFERDIQAWFLQRPVALAVINRIYSFIHIPGTMTFLAWLYWYAPPELYQARRRTLAICNLMAFVVFTSWPCMPPRLLPATDGFGFVDTVHTGGSSSVWTTNKFCNQLAAMPSLHFGYSFVVGRTIATVPIDVAKTYLFGIPRRLIFASIGILYPVLILIAIVATANHFILDAVAGFAIAMIGWNANKLLLNLLPLEDSFLFFCHLHHENHWEEAPVMLDNGWLKEKTDAEYARGWLKSP